MPGSIGPEVVPDDLFCGIVGSLVEEVPDDCRPGKTGDLPGFRELEQVVPQGILIYARHHSERYDIDPRVPGDGLVDGLACIKIKYILLRNSPVSTEKDQAEGEERDAGR